MQLHIPLLSLLLSAIPTNAAPSRNLTSLGPYSNLPYPASYSLATCPASTNAWLSTQPQTLSKTNPRSLSTVSRPYPKRQPRSSSSLCTSIARQLFIHAGIESAYASPPLLLQAGIQYVIAFSSTNPVLGVTVWQAAAGSALSHMVAHPNFARTASGTVTFTLRRAAEVWVLLKFATGMPARGEVAVFALGTPSELNLEAGSGGL